MFVTKLKLGSFAVICAGLALTGMGGFNGSQIVAQDPERPPAQRLTTTPEKPESDEDFIRRLSMDLRGTAPTSTEVHFFASSTQAGKRQKLVDLFIAERQAKNKQTTAAQELAR